VIWVLNMYLIPLYNNTIIPVVYLLLTKCSVFFRVDEIVHSFSVMVILLSLVL